MRSNPTIRSIKSWCSMKQLNAGIIGIHQVNSVDFVRSAFQIYNSGDVLAVLRDEETELDLKREITPQPGGGWLDVHLDVMDDERPAQIVFTSGTEGAPKAILLSRKALGDVVVRLNRVMQVDASIREYVGIPVTYSFGFGRCRAVATAGGRCFIPDNGFNPVEVARMLAADEINAISAVPTLWRTVLAQPHIIGELGRKVKWIEIGSQYMSRHEKEQMKALFPKAVIVQHYGLTEASRTTFLVISDTDGERLESVGRVYGEVEVQTSPEGRIMIRGPNVTSGQLIDGEIHSLIDADGWYASGDFGHIEDGYLYYGGRADDVINCGGVKVNPDPLQQRINVRLHLDNQIAVSRIDDALRGDGFFIAVEAGAPVDPARVREAVGEELMALGINAGSSIQVQTVEVIPRTDTGKVRRRLLSQLYRPAETAKVAPRRPIDKAVSVHDLFAQVFPGVTLKPEDTFRSLGGDSLNYVQMVMTLEERFGYTPVNWDRMTLEALEKIEQRKGSTWVQWVDTSIFLRAAAITAVVATHSGGVVLGGGTMLLFVLIGYNMARFKADDFAAGHIWKWMATYAVVILIPYYVMAAIYQVGHREFEIDTILLYSNLVTRKITVMFPFWFVQVLLQCLLIVGALFSVKALRRYAAGTPFGFSLAMFAALFAVHELYPVFWHTEYWNGLVPTRFMVILWLGWSLYVAETRWQKVVISLAGVVLAFADSGLRFGTIWLLLPSLMLPFVPRVPVPALLKKPISDIGAATFYIFSVNGLIISVMAHIVDIPSILLVFVITMTLSMGVWWIMERMRLVARIQTTLNLKLKAGSA